MYKIFTAIIFSLLIISLPVQAARKPLELTADSPACKYDKNDDVHFGVGKSFS